MKKYKYLHIMHNEKFINAYIEFVNKNFDIKEHLFFVFDGVEEKKITILKEKNIIRHISIGSTLKKRYLKYIFYLFQLPILYFKLVLLSSRVEKIFFHGLFDSRIVVFLYLFSYFLKKSYWIIWGGDLYCYRKRDKKPGLLKKMYYHIETKVKGNFKWYISDIYGDYELVQLFYGAKGKLCENFSYPSNLYKNIKLEKKESYEKNIQIGNSGDPSNNHFEILEKLKIFKNENLQFYCILSYGATESYKNKVINKGTEIFGEKFKPILKFMEYDEYIKFLSKIDIAIFAHDRQQAFGNITSLLSMKKTVYIKENVSTYDRLDKLGIKIKKFNKMENLEIFDDEILENNRKIIKNYYSEENLYRMWERIFNN